MSGSSPAATLLLDTYLPLVKSRQTFLLTLTGVAGYLCQPGSPDWLEFSSLVGSLLLSIGGCSVLNMAFDRDIDRLMRRTSQRPVAAGLVSPGRAAILGGVMIGLGLLWAAMLSTLYFALVLLGAVLNVLIYTLWLKRRTAWSILWGGAAGGMPILAGRALAMGHIDVIGLLLALVIFFWIPSHNLTLTSLHASDYLAAGVPAFVNSYGLRSTLRLVVLTSLLAVLLIVAVSILLGSPVLLFLFSFGSLGWVGFATSAWMDPSMERIRRLYKYSSLYMLAVMLLLALIGSG